jgi:hypothetical protein
MPVHRHSEARAAPRVTARGPEPRKASLSEPGKGRCSSFPGLPCRPPGMTILALIGLLLTLWSAGCAETGTTSDNDKRPVFYGGVNGGVTQP